MSEGSQSTLLEPLEFIFETSGKPQKGSTFPLGNLPGSDLALWQDYEHDEDTVCFTDLLSVFVGESIELRAPGELNHNFRNKAPLFYSGRVPLQCTRRDKAAEAVLNGMVAERFATFEFTVPLPKRERKADWTHCVKCCAAFYLRGVAAATAGATPAAVATAPPATSAPAAPGAPLPLAATASPAPTLAVGAGSTTTAALGAGTGPSASALAFVVELQKLFDLHSRGGLSKEEFEMAKRMLFSM